MGYTTEFFGQLSLNKPADAGVRKTLAQLCDYNPYQKESYDPALPKSYCKWILTDDGKGLVWNGEEKFYLYVEWLEYLIAEVFAPAGYRLSGELLAEGEEIEEDVSKIIVKDNVVTRVVYSPKDIAAHLLQKEKQASTEVGTILFSSDVVSLPLYKHTTRTLKDLVMTGLFADRSSHQQFVVMQEKDGAINLYDVSEDEMDNGKIPSLTFREQQRYNLHIPVSRISEIIQYSFPLSRFLFRAKTAYLFCYGRGDHAKKVLYVFENDDFVSQLREQLSEDDYLFRRSYDVFLAFWVLRKVVTGLALGLITWGVLHVFFLFLRGIFRNVSDVSGFVVYGLFLLILTGMLYAIKKYFFPLWWHVFLTEVFRSFYHPNSVK